LVTTKSAFTPEEWKTILEGPPSAGMIVITAAHGGMFRETIAMSKAYVEACGHPGETELVDEIVTAKPAMDHTRYHSPEELKEKGLGHLSDAVTLLENKATPEELDGYRRFILSLATKVAAAHDEGGQSESPGETDAIRDIAAALGAPDAA
jgi:hypothetical protein